MTEGTSEEIGVVIGKATAMDGELLEALQESLHPDGSRFQLGEERAHDFGHVWWANVGGDPAGYLLVRLLLGDAEILHVEVGMRFRKRGVGTALIEELLRVDEVTKVFLEVREGNVVARKLYMNLGFEVTGRRDGYYAQPREDAILMMWQRR